jgi:hypothetical protein
VDLATCSANDCPTTTKFAYGLGFMVVTDGAGLVTNLIKALGGG